jgi:ubiquinone/menaquinone biosynthesis C-methylase UbiE
MEIPEWFEKPILDVGCGFNDSGACVKLDYVTQVGTVGPTVANVLGDAQNMPFKDESFNSIYSTQAFEHFYNIDEVIKECYRILKPEGLILVDVPLDCDHLTQTEDLMEINAEILEEPGALEYYKRKNWVSHRFGKPIVDVHVRTCTKEMVEGWFKDWKYIDSYGGTFVYQKQ